MKKHQSSLKANAVLNVTKQCCNIIFPLISYPFITRVLGADSLGRYSFSESVVSYFSLIASLGIPTYAIREGARIRSQKESLCQFTAEIFTINIIASLFSFGLLLLAISFFPRLQRDAVLIYIISTNIIWTLLGRDWINSIYEDFLYITVRYILFQILALILIFTFIKIPSDYKVYTAIMVLCGNCGANLLNIIYTQKYVPFSVTRHLNLKRHLKPIFFLFCTSVAITIYIKSDITILGFLRSDEEVGVYTVSSRIYTLVKSTLNAIIMVTIPRISNYLGEAKISEYHSTLNTLRKALCIFVFPCIIGLFLLSKEIVCLVGGQAFYTGHSALRILCFALGFAVFGCFYSNAVLVVNRKEKYFFYATILSAAVNIVLNIIMIPYFGIDGAALTTVFAEFLVLVICRYYSRKNIQIHDDGNLKSVILGCTAIAITCITVKELIHNQIAVVITAMLCSSAVYALVLWYTKNAVFIKMFGYIKRR